jgi:phytoene dehydrogenase-like protein
MVSQKVVVVGAGINGLIAANYLQRAGFGVTVIERAHRVGGACVSETTTVHGVQQSYALGASVLGLMPGFVFQETGLGERLRTFVPHHPKLIHFPGDAEPTRIFRDPAMLRRELADRWGEMGDVQAFRADEARVVSYLQDGYRNATPPSLAEAEQRLGKELVGLWITGSAGALFDHYFTAEKTMVYMAMTVNESGPVSLFEPYSAFNVPLMDSGSIFDGYYGFVRGGIWQITEELARLNQEIGVVTHVNSEVIGVDAGSGTIQFDCGGQTNSEPYDHLLFATDPVTAARLSGSTAGVDLPDELRVLGTSGKLNLMFRRPVCWKHDASDPGSDAAFRFIFSVDTIEAFERATLRVAQDSVAYEPGYMQIYCEGAAMRQLHLNEPFDRLAVFFKNLSLGAQGADLPEVENRVRDSVLQLIKNPEDCAWTRLLTPRDLQQTFLFPGGNLDHTMLVAGQTFSERRYSDERRNGTGTDTGFYLMGSADNVYLCGAGAYPCGSVAGTPGYMCAQQLIRECSHLDQP